MTRTTRLLAALLLAVAVPGQERSVVHQIDGREVVTVRAVPFAGANEPGGLGFVAVHVENRDDAPHVVVVDCGSHPWGDSGIAVRRELRLGPHELGRCFLPLPTAPDPSYRFDVTIDGAFYDGSIGAGRRDGIAGLLISARSDTEAWGVTVLQAMARSAKPATGLTTVAPEDLPADWRLYTGFHAVLVDGRARLGDEVQAALVDFAAAGGTLVVAEPDRLPAGELRERCRPPAGDGVVPIGLGRCVLAPGDADTTRLRARLASVPPPPLAGWPAPEVLLREQLVPGLGAAPVLVFLVVILLFAVVVGPVNFLLLRRWRRPLLVLVTVPLCGLGTTLVMLGYGLVHDGLGARGVVRSWTLLDQDRHEAHSLAARTLFVGLSPDVLQVAPDGFVVAPRASSHGNRRESDRWQFDPVANVLDGGVLPSRLTTPLLSARHGIARQRLRARLAGDRLELLTDGGVLPIGPVLLRDPDGGLWLGEAPSLRPADAGAARAALVRWQGDAAVLRLRGGDADGGETETELAGAHHVVARLLGGRELPPGSYVARVQHAPWLDDHGLDVAYDQSDHFVVGLLAAEDFVR